MLVTKKEGKIGQHQVLSSGNKPPVCVPGMRENDVFQIQANSFFLAKLLMIEQSFYVSRK